MTPTPEPGPIVFEPPTGPTVTLRLPYLRHADGSQADFVVSDVSIEALAKNGFLPASALQSANARIKELTSALVDKNARIAELEAEALQASQDLRSLHWHLQAEKGDRGQALRAKPTEDSALMPVAEYGRVVRELEAKLADVTRERDEARAQLQASEAAITAYAAQRDRFREQHEKLVEWVREEIRLSRIRGHYQKVKHLTEVLQRLTQQDSSPSGQKEDNDGTSNDDGPGAKQREARDRRPEGGAEEPRASTGHHEAGRSAALGRRSDDDGVAPIRWAREWIEKVRREPISPAESLLCDAIEAVNDHLEWLSKRASPAAGPEATVVAEPDCEYCGADADEPCDRGVDHSGPVPLKPASTPMTNGGDWREKVVTVGMLADAARKVGEFTVAVTGPAAMERLADLLERIAKGGAR